VLDRAVGPFAEPLRVLANVRVIGRALERDIHRDLEAGFVGAFDECPKVVEGAEFVVNRFVSGFGRAGGPRAAGIRGSRRWAGSWAFAMGLADGMNGREIKNIKAHFGDSG